MALQLELAAGAVEHGTDAELVVVCTLTAACMEEPASLASAPLLGQELGCGHCSKGSLATGKGAPSLSYESCAVLLALLEGLVDHGAEKWFLFQAGGQREQGGEEHVSVLLRGMFMCFILNHP